MRASASDALLPLLSHISHEPFGAVHGWVWQTAAGPVLHERQFDTHGRMIRHPLGEWLRSIHYDVADRIAAYAHVDRASGASTVASVAQDQTFGYDELGRLTSARQADKQWTYAYDANGNRTEVQAAGRLQIYSTDPASNRLLAVSNPPRTFGHDPAGNRISDGQGPALARSGYDLSNRLATLEGSAPWIRSLSLGFQYNAFGQRVAKLIGIQSSCNGNIDCVPRAPTAIVFVYDQQGHLLGEYRSQDGAMLREYIWLGDTPIAVIAPDAAMADEAVPVFFIHSDHLDTPRVIVDRNGRVRWTWLSEPFGNAQPNSNPSGLRSLGFNLRFPGQYFDTESRLMHNGFRDFDAAVGRYTQSDPIGLQGGINTYAYVFNQPTRYTDPDGRIVPAIAACAANPACVAAVGAGAVVIGAAAKDGYDRWMRRPEPMLLLPPKKRDDDGSSVPWPGRMDFNCPLVDESWNYCIYQCKGIPYQQYRSRSQCGGDDKPCPPFLQLR